MSRLVEEGGMCIGVYTAGPLTTHPIDFCSDGPVTSAFTPPSTTTHQA